MTALQIVGFIGIGIVLIGAIFLTREQFKTGFILMIIGAMLGMAGAVGYQVELDRDTPTALDVYRGKTTLEITYRDLIAIDTTVVYKVKK